MQVDVTVAAEAVRNYYRAASICKPVAKLGQHLVNTLGLRTSNPEDTAELMVCDDKRALTILYDRFVKFDVVPLTRRYQPMPVRIHS
jgi:hypothetical protein